MRSIFLILCICLTFLMAACECDIEEPSISIHIENEQGVDLLDSTKVEFVEIVNIRDPRGDDWMPYYYILNDSNTGKMILRISEIGFNTEEEATLFIDYTNANTDTLDYAVKWKTRRNGCDRYSDVHVRMNGQDLETNETRRGYLWVKDN